MSTVVQTIKNVLRPIYAPMYNTCHDLFFGARRYKYLFDAIRKTRALRIMEIGTWNGDRAVKMIRLAQRLNPGMRIEYYGFDLFEALDLQRYTVEISKWPLTQAEVKQKLEATGAAIALCAGDTRETLPRMSAELPAMDVIFIDGGHSKTTIQNDWDYSSVLMHKHTIVLFDDYWPDDTKDGARPVIDAIDQTRFTVEILPIGDSFRNEDFGTLTIKFARVKRSN